MYEHVPWECFNEDQSTTLQEPFPYIPVIGIKGSRHTC